jgi:hypothetical protein
VRDLGVLLSNGQAVFPFFRLYLLIYASWFGSAWAAFEAAKPVPQWRRARFADLPREIAVAEALPLSPIYLSRRQNARFSVAPLLERSSAVATGMKAPKARELRA